MLVTKEQQKHITKTLNAIAAAIREEQRSDKEKCPDETGSYNERFVRFGRQAAYERAYHLAKTAEESYIKENNSLDDELE